MERLTECVGFQNDKPIYKTKIDMRKVGSVDKLKNALGKYEDAEEFGSLVWLPCRKNDILYAIAGNNVKRIYKMEVLYIAPFGALYEEENRVYNLCLDGNVGYMHCKFSDIGKTVFYTEYEANIALENLKNIKK